MRRYLVLFLGRANAGRTLMAEALVSRWATPRLMAASAGLEPSTEIDPGAALALRDELFMIAQAPRHLSDLLATLGDKIDLVIVLDPVGPELVVPGNPPHVQWHVEDPRLNPGGEKDRLRAWRGALRDLEARIKLLPSLMSQGVDDYLAHQRAENITSRVGQSTSARI